LRAALFGLLGDIGEDPQIIVHARQLSEQYLSDPGSVEGTLSVTALTVAAQNGDAAFFDQLQRASQTAGDPQLRTQALLVLARFRDPALVVRALDYAVSPQVRNQDALRLIQIELSDRRTQDVAWQYVRQNWSRVQSQITTFAGGDLVSSMSSFCSVDRSREVTEFFTEHTIPAASHALDKAQDSIADCVELRALQGQNLKRWLHTDAAHRPPTASQAAE
jgi:aminopeptidase N/puromycin-sensitive aminopeptidase